MALEIKNTSSTAYSFVKLSNIRYGDTAGSQIPAAGLDYSYVEGSVWNAGYSIRTDTCLAPGGTGRIVPIENLHTKLNGISFTIGGDNGNQSDPRPVILAQGCQVSTGITVDLRNSGTAAGHPYSSVTIFFDAAGVFTGWTFASVTSPSDCIIAAGGTGVPSAPAYSVPPSGKLVVHVSFDIPAVKGLRASYSRSAPFQSVDEYNDYMFDERNRREAEKQYHNG